MLIRIYDKAAERGFKSEKHWIRVELQLRKERALEAFKLLFDNEAIGFIASGIVRNYCMFVTPTADSNRARWPIADYWQRVLDGFEKIRIWSAPGEEYNFSKTENHLIYQYGQAVQTFVAIHGSLDPLLSRSCEMHQDLKPKYKDAIQKELARRQIEKERCDELRKMMGIVHNAGYYPEIFGQIDFAELVVQDPDFPFT